MILKPTNLSSKQQAFLNDLRSSVRSTDPPNLSCYHHYTSAWFRGTWYDEVPDIDFEEEIARVLEQEDCSFLGICRSGSRHVRPEQADWKWDIWITRNQGFNDEDLVKAAANLPTRESGEAPSVSQWSQFLMELGRCQTENDEPIDYDNQNLSAPYQGSWPNPFYTVLAFLTFDERRTLRRLIAEIRQKDPIDVPWLTIGYEPDDDEDELTHGELKRALVLFGERYVLSSVTT